MKKIRFIVIWIILFFVARENSVATTLVEHLQVAAVTLVFTIVIIYALFHHDYSVGKK